MSLLYLAPGEPAHFEDCDSRDLLRRGEESGRVDGIANEWAK